VLPVRVLVCLWRAFPRGFAPALPSSRHGSLRRARSRPRWPHDHYHDHLHCALRSSPRAHVRLSLDHAPTPLHGYTPLTVDSRPFPAAQVCLAFGPDKPTYVKWESCNVTAGNTSAAATSIAGFAAHAVVGASRCVARARVFSPRPILLRARAAAPRPPLLPPTCWAQATWRALHSLSAAQAPVHRVLLGQRVEPTVETCLHPQP